MAPKAKAFKQPRNKSNIPEQSVQKDAQPAGPVASRTSPRFQKHIANASIRMSTRARGPSAAAAASIRHVGRVCLVPVRGDRLWLILIRSTHFFLFPSQASPPIDLSTLAPTPVPDVPVPEVPASAAGPVDGFPGATGEWPRLLKVRFLEPLFRCAIACLYAG